MMAVQIIGGASMIVAWSMAWRLWRFEPRWSMKRMTCVQPAL
eukprot:XP_001705237.1 Hypothetical protein GL50803_29352 [Giardia lamblia ATCC 50803]